MPQEKTSSSSAPHYLRATVVSTLAASVIPTALVLFGIFVFQDGPPVKASEAAGSVIILVHLLAAVAFVAIAFPFAGWHLHTKDALTRQRFYKTLFVLLIAGSLLSVALLGFIGFGLSAIVFAPVSFIFLALFALPFRSLWFKLAQ